MTPLSEGTSEPTLLSVYRDDPILARADCAWLHDNIRQSGSLVLSGRQLTFQSAEQDVVLRKLILSITGSMVTEQGRLMVQLGKETLWFSTAAAALGHRLAALRGHGDQEFEASEEVYLSGPCRRWLGPLPLSGVATLTSHRLRFTASGFLSGLLRRLGLVTDLDQSPPTTPVPLRGSLARLIEQYLQAPHPVAGWLARRHQRMLPMLLTDDALHVGSLSLPLGEISDVSASDHTLTLRCSGRPPLRLQLSYAAAAAQQIKSAIGPPTNPALPQEEVEMHSTWTRGSTPENVLPWAAAPQSGLLSKVRSTRLHMPDGEVLEMTPGLAMTTEDGIGIAIPEHVETPAPGTAISVELGQPDGIYTVEGVVLRTAPLPASVQIPRRGHLLVLAAPDEIRYFNRRSAFRVPISLQVNAWRLREDPARQTWMPDGGRLAGELVDLSESGCALQTTDSIAIGTRMFLELRISEHWLPLEAQVVRTEQGWPMTHTLLGIQFINVPNRLGRLLGQTVQEEQRRSV